ncbi:hypothetical protein B0H13DRAFT_1911441 [Mycena leptocephala]|nr:hypothetical protein B0H13DRAFT_1911441 [Mycena leptocephala]
MHKKGFTAEVSCAFPNLTADTSSILHADTVKDCAFGLPSEIVTHLQIFPNNCITPDRSRVNFTQTYTVGRPNYVLMIACGGFQKPTELQVYGKHRLHIRSENHHRPSRLHECGYQHYAAGQWGQNVGGLAGLSAVTTISNMQFFAQTIFANVGDEL